jgi:hypothetical protein
MIEDAAIAPPALANLFKAVVLVVFFTVLAFQTCGDLCSYTNSFSNLNRCNLQTNLVIVPMISWPTQSGKLHLQPPVIVWMSLPQTPQASIAMSTSWLPKAFGLNWDFGSALH